MTILLFGIWDKPVSDYWLFYCVLGIVGFLLCYFRRYFLVLILPVIIWFSNLDIQSFYQSRQGIYPGNGYVFLAVATMILALLASVFGAILNNRKLMALN